MTHLDEASINDLVDGVALPDELAAHAAACAACMARVHRMRELLTRLDQLPAEIRPARDLLPGIHAALHAPPARAVPQRGMFAAAVVVLTVAAAALTLVVSSGRRNAVPPVAQTAPGVMYVAALRASEAPYVDAIAELRGALDTGALDPATEDVLERSLDAIDRALAEARAALAADPGNGGLAELLRAGYEKKLDLLRRASTHGRGRL